MHRASAYHHPSKHVIEVAALNGIHVGHPQFDEISNALVSQLPRRIDENPAMAALEIHKYWYEFIGNAKVKESNERTFSVEQSSEIDAQAFDQVKRKVHVHSLKQNRFACKFFRMCSIVLEKKRRVVIVLEKSAGL